MVLQQLLRKKPDLDVEEWVSEGKREGESIEGLGEGGDTAMEDAGEEEQEEKEDITKVWEDVFDWFGERVAKYVAEESSALYTAEEEAMGVENVNTGNKRDYEDESDSDEEEGEGKKVSAGVDAPKPLSLDERMEFWTTGRITDKERVNENLFRRGKKL